MKEEMYRIGLNKGGVPVAVVFDNVPSNIGYVAYVGPQNASDFGSHTKKGILVAARTREAILDKYPFLDPSNGDLRRVGSGLEVTIVPTENGLDVIDTVIDFGCDNKPLDPDVQDQYPDTDFFSFAYLVDSKRDKPQRVQERLRCVRRTGDGWFDQHGGFHEY